MDSTTGARRAIYLARALIALAFLALLGAWVTQLTGATLLGMSQQHFFNDASALALLGIALFVDAYWHARNL